MVSALLFSEEPSYANVTYVDGASVTIVSGAVTRRYNPAVDDLFGLALSQGDIIQTGAGTYLELTINALSVRVQVAENTSFRCTADATGRQSTGELYYGRVRAKVSKLTGSDSYRITTPSLVAGVRGTDFGCDVIAVRQPAAVGRAAVDTVLDRVFVFEGQVAVQTAAVPSSSSASTVAPAAAVPVLVNASEMVERLASGETVVTKKTIDPQIAEFWLNVQLRLQEAADETPVAVAEPETVLPEAVTKKPAPETVETPPVLTAEERTPEVGRNKTPGYVAGAALMGFGAVSGGLGYVNSQVDTVDQGKVEALYLTGALLAGTGLLFILFNALLD